MAKNNANPNLPLAGIPSDILQTPSVAYPLAVAGAGAYATHRVRKYKKKKAAKNEAKKAATPAAESSSTPAAPTSTNAKDLKAEQTELEKRKAAIADEELEIKREQARTGKLGEPDERLANLAGETAGIDERLETINEVLTTPPAKWTMAHARAATPEFLREVFVDPSAAAAQQIHSRITGKPLSRPAAAANPTNAVSPLDLENSSRGWKLHLNVGRAALPEDQYMARMKPIMDHLLQLKTEGVIKDFKFNFANSYGLGKDFTVYIGDEARAQQVATDLAQRFDGQLLSPGQDALAHGRVFNPKVVGRFDVGSNGSWGIEGDSAYDYYGERGLPKPRDGVDVSKLTPEEQDAYWKNVAQNLQERYGTAFAAKGSPSFVGEGEATIRQTVNEIDQQQAAINTAKASLNEEITKNGGKLTTSQLQSANELKLQQDVLSNLRDRAITRLSGMNNAENNNLDRLLSRQAELEANVRSLADQLQEIRGQELPDNFFPGDAEDVIEGRTPAAKVKATGGATGTSTTDGSGTASTAAEKLKPPILSKANLKAGMTEGVQDFLRGFEGTVPLFKTGLSNMDQAGRQAASKVRGRLGKKTSTPTEAPAAATGESSTDTAMEGTATDSPATVKPRVVITPDEPLDPAKPTAAPRPPRVAAATGTGTLPPVDLTDYRSAKYQERLAEVNARRTAIDAEKAGLPDDSPRLKELVLEDKVLKLQGDIYQAGIARQPIESDLSITEKDALDGLNRARKGEIRTTAVQLERLRGSPLPENYFPGENVATDGGSVDFIRSGRTALHAGTDDATLVRAELAELQTAKSRLENIGKFSGETADEINQRIARLSGPEPLDINHDIQTHTFASDEAAAPPRVTRVSTTGSTRSATYQQRYEQELADVKDEQAKLFAEKTGIEKNAEARGSLTTAETQRLAEIDSEHATLETRRQIYESDLASGRYSAGSPAAEKPQVSAAAIPAETTAGRPSSTNSSSSTTSSSPARLRVVASSSPAQPPDVKAIGDAEPPTLRTAKPSAPKVPAAAADVTAADATPASRTSAGADSGPPKAPSTEVVLRGSGPPELVPRPQYTVGPARVIPNTGGPVSDGAATSTEIRGASMGTKVIGGVGIAIAAGQGISDITHGHTARGAAELTAAGGLTAAAARFGTPGVIAGVAAIPAAQSGYNSARKMASQLKQGNFAGAAETYGLTPANMVKNIGTSTYGMTKAAVTTEAAGGGPQEGMIYAPDGSHYRKTASGLVLVAKPPVGMRSSDKLVTTDNTGNLVYQNQNTGALTVLNVTADNERLGQRTPLTKTAQTNSVGETIFSNPSGTHFTVRPDGVLAQAGAPRSLPTGARRIGETRSANGTLQPVYESATGARYRTNTTGTQVYQSYAKGVPLTLAPTRLSGISGSASVNSGRSTAPTSAPRTRPPDTVTSPRSPTTSSAPRTRPPDATATTIRRPASPNEGSVVSITRTIKSGGVTITTPGTTPGAVHILSTKPHPVTGDKLAQEVHYSDGSVALTGAHGGTRYRWLSPPSAPKPATTTTTPVRETTVTSQLVYRAGKWVDPRNPGVGLTPTQQSAAASAWRSQHPATTTTTTTPTGQQTPTPINRTVRPTTWGSPPSSLTQSTPIGINTVRNPIDRRFPTHTVGDQTSWEPVTYGGTTGVIRHNFSDGTSTYVKDGHVIGREVPAGTEVGSTHTIAGVGNSHAWTPSPAPIPQAMPAPTTPIYTAGRNVVSSFTGANGAHFDVTESGAVIETASGSSSRRVGWVNPNAAGNINSATDLKGSVHPGSASPFSNAATMPPPNSPIANTVPSYTPTAPTLPTLQTSPTWNALPAPTTPTDALASYNTMASLTPTGAGGSSQN